MKRLAIIGASGHGTVAAETAELLGWSSISFFDDLYPEKYEVSKWQVIGDVPKLIDTYQKFDGFHVAIGDNITREEITLQLQKNEIKTTSIIHPTAVISETAKIGQGTAVFANVVLNAGVEIGEGSILNTSCSIDHNSKLGNFSHISPHASIAGGVAFGHRSWLGIGACIIQCVKVGSDVMIGAGSAVTKNLPSKTTAVGVPCKIIRRG